MKLKTEMNLILAMSSKQMKGINVENHTFLTFAPNTMDITPLAK